MEINKNYIDECLEEFDEKTKFLEIRKGDGMQVLPIEENDRDNLKNFLKQKLQQIEKKSYEKGFTEGSELTGRIAEETQGKKFEDNFENGETLSDDAFITETEFGKCIKETLNLKSLKTKK